MAELITESTYQEKVINSDIPVLLDIFTPSCGPCRALLPTITKLAIEYAGRVKIVKLDGSKDINLATSTLRVSSVPSLIVFKNGVEVSRKTGFMPEIRLREWLEEIA